jgi:hypothetical protein
VPQDHDPGHWRERADEARAQAELMNDEGSRDVLLWIANSYDILAEQARGRDDQRPFEI